MPKSAAKQTEVIKEEDEDGDDMDGFEMEIEEEASIDFRFKLSEQVELEYKRRMKNLSTATKLYIWLRNRYIVDILFKKSPEHLQHIVEELRKGSTSSKSKVEIGVKFQVTADILEDL